nr:hypothetical protein [uncultured Lichenicoccus sp.]
MCDAASAIEAPAPRRLLAVLDQIEAAIPKGRTIEVWASGSTVGHVIRLRVKSEPGNADLGRLIEVLKEFDVRAQALTEPDTWLEVALPLSRAPDPATPPQPDYRRQYQGEHHAEHLA